MSRWKLCNEVLGEKVEDEMVLLDAGGGQYFELNATGARVVDLLSETGDPSEIARRMAEEFDADPARMEADIRELLQDMEEHGLVEKV